MSNVVSRSVGVILWCVALLGLIFAFMSFMRMQEDIGENMRFRNQGVVSRAVVTDKKTDKLTTKRRAGRSKSIDLQVLHLRHVRKSTVRFADFGTKVKEADLPVAPPVTGDVMQDMDYVGVMFVPMELYERTKVGDMLTVVNTPFDPGEPALVSEVKSFDPTIYHPRIAIGLALAAVFTLAAVLFGRRARARTTGNPAV